MIDVVIVYHPEPGDRAQLSPHKVWRALVDEAVVGALNTGPVRSVIVIDGETGLSGNFRDDGVTR